MRAVQSKRDSSLSTWQPVTFRRQPACVVFPSPWPFSRQQNFECPWPATPLWTRASFSGHWRGPSNTEAASFLEHHGEELTHFHALSTLCLGISMSVGLYLCEPLSSWIYLIFSNSVRVMHADSWVRIGFRSHPQLVDSFLVPRFSHL